MAYTIDNMIKYFSVMLSCSLLIWFSTESKLEPRAEQKWSSCKAATVWEHGTCDGEERSSCLKL